MFTKGGREGGREGGTDYTRMLLDTGVKTAIHGCNEKHTVNAVLNIPFPLLLSSDLGSGCLRP